LPGGATGDGGGVRLGFGRGAGGEVRLGVREVVP
jgi:hypothetical protein